MKPSDKPQISKKWWTSEKPAEIKGVELEKALQVAEKALDDEKKMSDPRSIEACMAMLRDLCSAADKTIKKELDKKKHKDEITVLEKYDGLVKVEVKRLEEAKAKLSASQNGDAENEDDEESEDTIFQPEYLYKMLKLLRSTGKELNFGFGLNTKDPAASKLLLTRKGKPDRLFKALKKDGEFNNRLITYGKAVPDAQDGKTLVFKLAESAGEPPQIQKLGRQYLRGDKNLKFRKLKLVLLGGQTLEDTEPDTEDEGGEKDVIASAAAGPSKASSTTAGAGSSQQGDLSKELATAQGSISAWQRTLVDVSAQVESLRKELEKHDDPQLRAIREGLATVMSQFPDLDLATLVAAAKANDRSAYDQTLQQTVKEIDNAHKLLVNWPLLSTIDKNPYVKTNIHTTVNSVLESISKELAA